MRLRATINSRKDNLRTAPEYIRSRRNFRAYARVCIVGCISDVCYTLAFARMYFCEPPRFSEMGKVIELHMINYIIENEFFFRYYEKFWLPWMWAYRAVLKRSQDYTLLSSSRLAFAHSRSTRASGSQLWHDKRRRQQSRYSLISFVSIRLSRKHAPF